MKKFIYILIAIAVCSCTEQEPDNLFDKSPEVRISEVKAQYSQILTSAVHGWKTYFSSNDKVGRWLILMDFDTDGTVVIKSDPVDYFTAKGIANDDTITYRVDFSQSPELVFESFSQFSAWNDFIYDRDGDGYYDSYAGPETQFLIDRYEDGKLYLISKTDIGVGKNNAEISRFVFEPAAAGDWNLGYVAQMKKKIGFDNTKGNYSCFKYRGEFLESVFLVDANYRVGIYYSQTPTGNRMEELPFYITPEGFDLNRPLQLEGIGSVQHFVLDPEGGYLKCTDVESLTLDYTDRNPAVLRTPITALDRMYLALDVYHTVGDPIGLDLKTILENLRPPYAPDKQHLNAIYWVRNISKDMGGLPFQYPEEICLVFADTDPSYSGHDLHGENVTAVHIPVRFMVDAKRLLDISLLGSIEKAFLDAYPREAQYARQKAEENIPLLSELFTAGVWGIYGQDLDTNNPTLKFIDESKPDKSFFTTYPYTVEDVNR